MGVDSTDQGSSPETKAPKDDATKDASAKDDVSHGTGTKSDADKSKDDDVSGLKKALQAERKLREGLEKEKREVELSKLPELERAKAEAIELAAENEKLKSENLRQKIALELGLPWKLARRLSGDSEDELREDAADLLKDYKPAEKQVIRDDPKNKRPPNDAKKSGSAGGPGMNDILRALAGRKGS